jgi:iron complex transport system ATP-binding protein
MHDLTLAGQYADRVALLVAGKLVAAGTPAEVLTEPAIADHYRAQVRVLQMNGSGRAVIPIRGHDAAQAKNRLP